MTAIFFHNEEQKRLALESKNRVAAMIEEKIYTKILPASEFYLAEAYHQKYYLQQKTNIMKEFKAMYPNVDGFIASTAAARINGYLAGYGIFEELKGELNGFGLSPEANQELLDIVSRLHR